MLLHLPGLVLTDDLLIRVGPASVRLTATDGFTLAERLLRGSTRLAIQEEAAAAPRPKPAPRVRANRRVAA